MAGDISRTRRTRVVPRSYDHQLSSSMGPSHFFKIILPSTIDDKKLVIVLPTLLVCFSFLDYSGS
jgi:hypothetical protein